LLVAGRHIRALRFLDLLLGDAQALTLPQRFYERALSGDSNEILAVGRVFLKRNSFAAYCDLVLIPALHLGVIDRAAGTIDDDQYARLRSLLVEVVSALCGEPRRLRQRLPSVLDDLNAGLILRQHREQLSENWQRSVALTPQSILLCLGLESPADTLIAELLVRALREQGLDARHVSKDDFDAGSRSPPNPAAVGLVYLVSAFPSVGNNDPEHASNRIRQHLPGVRIVLLSLPKAESELSEEVAHVDYVVSSFVDAAGVPQAAAPERREE
jgi:hypothetical protein